LEFTTDGSGRYHYAELVDLDEDSSYYFRITHWPGDLFLLKGNVSSDYTTSSSNSFKTLPLSEDLSVPIPIYGEIKSDYDISDTCISDSRVYLELKKGDIWYGPSIGKLNEEGRWTLDLSIFKDVNGNQVYTEGDTSVRLDIWGEIGDCGDTGHYRGVPLLDEKVELLLL